MAVKRVQNPGEIPESSFMRMPMCWCCSSGSSPIESEADAKLLELTANLLTQQGENIHSSVEIFRRSAKAGTTYDRSPSTESVEGHVDKQA